MHFFARPNKKTFHTKNETSLVLFARRGPQLEKPESHAIVAKAMSKRPSLGGGTSAAKRPASASARDERADRPTDLAVGSQVEALDVQELWFPACIKTVRQREVLVSFDGWDSQKRQPYGSLSNVLRKSSDLTCSSQVKSIQKQQTTLRKPTGKKTPGGAGTHTGTHSFRYRMSIECAPEASRGGSGF